MSSLKSHLTLILALVSIMISIFIFRTFNNILKKYENIIINDYSIIIVSTTPISTLPIKDIYSITQIDISKEITKLKNKYKNIDFTGIKLPFFYRIKLNHLPSPEELKEIRLKLQQLPYIEKVMTQSSSQTKIYNLLYLLKLVSTIFMILISALGFLLIVKQLEVWKLIHSERMYIMELFGAPFWFRAAALFKIAFIDSMISLIISILTINYITNHEKFYKLIHELHIQYSINYFNEFLILFTISILISIISTIIVTSTGKK